MLKEKRNIMSIWRHDDDDLLKHAPRTGGPIHSIKDTLEPCCLSILIHILYMHGIGPRVFTTLLMPSPERSFRMRNVNCATSHRTSKPVTSAQTSVKP